MTGRIGFAALAACALALLVELTAPRASVAAPDGCAQALALEKTAAADSAAPKARYDAAVAGLAANQRCHDARMQLVNEAYLLSMRAPAAHDLNVGDWRRDLTRANMLLMQCTNWPGLKGTKAGADCAQQRSFNNVLAQSLDAPAPTARPAPSPAPTPTPAPAPMPSATDVLRAPPPPPPVPATTVTPAPSASPLR
jgi:hypothetical protein